MGLLIWRWYRPVTVSSVFGRRARAAASSGASRNLSSVAVDSRRDGQACWIGVLFGDERQLDGRMASDKAEIPPMIVRERGNKARDGKLYTLLPEGALFVTVLFVLSSQSDNLCCPGQFGQVEPVEPVDQ